MVKKNGHPEVTETVPTEVETSATAEVAVAEIPTETTIPEPVTAEAVVEEKAAEVVAEQPKPAAPAPVMTTVQRKTPPDMRRYRLLRNPSLPPKGTQRIIVLHLLNEARKAGKFDISAKEMEKDADSFNYRANAGTVLSIQWHLHQMTLSNPPLVQLTNPMSLTTVEQTVTPAEATMSNDEIDAQIAKLNALKK
jgi:hypothetical protein